MSIDHPEASRPLPDRPNLRHLKDQAKDLLKAGAAASVTDAQFQIARLYGFSSWPKLKAHVESLQLDEWPASSQESRDALISAIVSVVASQDLLTRDEIRAALKSEINRAGPDALVALKNRL